MYHHVFVAGTFDRLHSGHKALLRAAFEMGEKVTVGITSDKFVNEYKLSAVSYQLSVNNIARCTLRKQAVLEWLTSQGYVDRVSFVYIHTPYEPATTVHSVDALVVTNQNRKIGEEINEKRKTKNLPLFHLIEVDIVPAEDSEPISSTRIRSGDIDKEGNLVMPESLRSLLQKPLGKVLTGSDILASIKNHESSGIITVGDMATKTVVYAGVIPFFAIIDGMVARKQYAPSATFISDGLSQQSGETDNTHIMRVKSGPGFISTAAVGAIDSVLELLKQPELRSILLVVDGEEDLLVLPVVEHATIGIIVYYGQPGKGLVEVIVSDDIKQRVQELLQKFER